jgi:hypothetical protein
MRVLLCLAARGIIRDATTNNVSVFSILEQFNAAGFPVVVPNVECLVVWQREAGDDALVPLTLKVMNNNVELASADVTVEFGQAQRHRTMVTFNAIVIREPGNLRFEFVRDDAVLASYSIEVAAPPAAAQQVE